MDAERARKARLTRIKTNRGNLYVDPATGRLEGFWRLCERELRTAAQCRELAGGVARDTLLRWRRADFPEPKLRIKARAGVVELFSRTEVEDWLERRQRAKEQQGLAR